MPRLHLNPDKPVIGLSTHERVLGRFLKATVDRYPESNAERDLLCDTFMAAWKHNPILLDEVPPDRAVNHALMSWALDNEFKEKSDSAGNLPASLFASSVLWTSLTTDAALQEALKKQREAEEMMRRADDLEKEAIHSLLDSDGETEGGGGAGDEGDEEGGAGEGVQDMLDEANNLRQKAQELAEEGMEEVEKVKDHPVRKQAIKSAVDKAQQSSETMKGAMKSWGIEPGLAEPTDIDGIINLAKSGYWKNISDLLGRAKERSSHIITASRQSTSGAVAKVGRTKNVSRLFSGEMMSISPDAPLPLQYRKLRSLVGSGLMGWIPTETMTKKGSFVMAVDESGSMGQDGCALAKAIALGIAMTVREELDSERHYELFGFTNDIERRVTSEEGWREHVAWASSFASGGTSLHLAVDELTRRIRSMVAKGIDTADGVILTDGEARLSQSDFARLDDLKAKHGVRLAYIHLNTCGEDPNKMLIGRADVFINVPQVDLNTCMDKLVESITTMIVDHDRE